MNETKPVRVVHYLNQFFAGIGGEDKAGTAPLTMEGSVGPGRLLEQSSGGAIQVVGTVVCGDNYFVEEPGALDAILDFVRRYQPDGFIAGPAFAAGRYGEACTAVCLAVQEKLGIPVITGLAPESPAVESNRQKLPILRTGNTAADMKNSMPQMGGILLQLIRGADLAATGSLEKLYPRGFKQNKLMEVNAAERAIRMLLSKYKGEPWQTEVSMVLQESVAPAPAVKEKGFLLALVTDGGLVLKGNPEGMPAVRSKRYCRIGIESWNKLTPDQVEVSHSGYDNRYVVEEPNRLLPLDALREVEQSGEVRLHSFIYSTAGVSTAIEDAASMGRGIADELLKAGVQAAILTST
jgi:glycine reductase